MKAEHEIKARITDAQERVVQAIIAHTGMSRSQVVRQGVEALAREYAEIVRWVHDVEADQAAQELGVHDVEV